jgi:hypothetical protein
MTTLYCQGHSACTSADGGGNRRLTLVLTYIEHTNIEQERQRTSPGHCHYGHGDTYLHNSCVKVLCMASYIDSTPFVDKGVRYTM